MWTLAALTLEVQDYITIGGILAPAVTAVSTIWLSWWLSRIDRKATKTVELSQPTGNGYAGRTEIALAVIVDRLDNLTQRFDAHLEERKK